MTYGQDSNISSYDDSGLWEDSPQIQDQNTQTQTQIPAFDPNKFVPVEKFQQVEQELNQLKPTFERLQNAFNPNQQPQLSQEEQNTNNFLNNFFENQAKAKGFMSRAEFQEALELREVGKWAEQRGIGDEVDADLFYQSTFRRLQRDSASNPTLNNIANNMATLYNNKQYSQLTKYLDSNLPKQYWNGANSQPQAQTVGQSFSNNPFSQTADYKTRLDQARRAGDTTAVNQILGEWGKSIGSNL